MKPTPEQISELQRLSIEYEKNMTEVLGRELDVTTVAHFKHTAEEPCSGVFIATAELDPYKVAKNLIRGMAFMENVMEDITSQAAYGSTKH